MVEPIESRFLNRRDLFALEYRNGIVPLEVQDLEDTRYEAFSNLEDIESGTSRDDGYQRIQDSNNDDLLFVPSDDINTVLHVGFGIAPSVIEAFIAYPEGSRSKGSLPDLSTQPTPGANHGYIDGNDSPYRNPSVKTELVIPPKQRISVDFQNPGDDTHEPLLNFVYRKYKVNTIDPRKNSNEVRRIVSPGSPAPIFPVGNFEEKADFNIDEWSVSPRSRSRLMSMVSGGGR